ncbi:MAG: hypothetical protein ACNFW9_05735 [Candidatus Kerfeldbacteria bacterium]
MNKKLITSLVVIISIALTVGIVNAAATHNVTSQFGPEGDIYQVDGTMKMRSIMIGEQDIGGVTYFNGSIVNDTTTNSVDNPVTFGDNVRIDGRVWRGATAGTSDTMPFIVNDNMEVIGSLTVGSLMGTGIVTSTNIAAGAITQTSEAYGTTTDTTTQNSPNYDILDETIVVTTGASTVLINFSGVFSINNDFVSARTFLIVDGTIVDHTIRRGTAASSGGPFNMAFNALVDVTAGSHTFQVGWNVDAGQTASIYNRTLDVVELKK